MTSLIKNFWLRLEQNGVGMEEKEDCESKSSLEKTESR
jgi:hypothetical protein